MTTINQKINIISSAVEDIRDAIQTVDPTKGLGVIDTLAGDVADLAGIEFSAPIKDFNFCDVEGKVIYSYTLEEALSSPVPDVPSISGLTSQGWNCGNTIAPSAYQGNHTPVFYTPMYVTSDGATRLYIDIPSTSERTNVGLYWNQTVTNGVTIDWGDESTATTSSGIGNKFKSHTYSTTGKYVISLTCTSGTFYLGNGSSSYNVLGSPNTYMSTFLYKVEFGSNITSIGNYAFNNCCNLQIVTIPNSFTEISNYSFRDCCNLKSACIPSSVTSIGNYAYNGSSGLKFITLPLSILSISGSAFNTCGNLLYFTIPSTLGTGFSLSQAYSLTSITYPTGITSMPSYSIDSNTIKEIHMLPTAPPTATSPLFSIPNDCVIYVPSGSLSTYQTASVWSTYTSKMVGE